MLATGLIHFNIVVCCANSLKCICLLYTAYLYQGKAEEPLATVGDAIVSFLARPDQTTKSMCLVSKYCMPKEKGKFNFIKKLTSNLPGLRAHAPALPKTYPGLWRNPHPLTWCHDRPRWSKAASRRRWLGTLIPSVYIISQVQPWLIPK